ncbi:MAG: zinc-binding dehydrogenase, partial [Acidimicrobiia bacterium]|nr:zinc-binding dehydrogenase [Acidimicrobiia bacterium]
MRFARLTAPRQLEIVSAPDPSPRPGQVVVEILACGVGGSDRQAWETGFASTPSWFGHEWTGRVVAIGDGVTGRFEGQRVVAGVSPPCGWCLPCSVGRAANCRSVLEQIVGLDELSADHGGFATLTVADARRVVPVDEAISFPDAALIEPAAVAAHAVRHSRMTFGDVVVVVGGGTVGLLTSEVARIAGAAHVVSVDPSITRNELACDLGVDAAFTAVDESLRHWIDDHTAGIGADVVFACVDTAEALAAGLSLVCSGGMIVGVGVGDRIDNLSVTSLLAREADFKVSLGYSADDIRRVQSLMRQDRLRVRPLLQPGTRSALD